MTKSESAELREARRRIRLLEQESEVLCHAAAYLSQALPENAVPARPESSLPTGSPSR